MGGLVTSLVLASGSPQRKRLLKELRVPFRIIVPNTKEISELKLPQAIAADIARQKARVVAAKNPEALVLGADTIVVYRGEILGKPRNRADSARMLHMLNGHFHRVITGVALIDAASGRCYKESVVSRVKARKLSDKDLGRFVGRHLDKAGAYAVQDKNDPFIEKIVGSYDNVVGLPLSAVRRLLREASRGRAASKRREAKRKKK
jgi:septum formation protein